MEESRICRPGVKTDMLCNSQSNDILQHHDSNCGGTGNKHSLEEDEGSDFITKNRNLVSRAYCMQESREKPGPKSGIEPSDSQQGSECNRNKERTLGITLCLMVEHFYTQLIYLCFLQHIYNYGIWQGLRLMLLSYYICFLWSGQCACLLQFHAGGEQSRVGILVIGTMVIFL